MASLVKKNDVHVLSFKEKILQLWPYLASILHGHSIDDFSSALSGDHVQKGVAQILPYAAMAYHFVPEQDQTQIVDILTIVLLYVHPVHVHQDVPGKRQ